MIPYTNQFPGVEVAIRTAGLARYVTFELSIEGLNVPLNTHLARSISANVAASLNDIVRQGTLPYLWVIDDDHQFDPWMLLRLLAHNKPVVTALTCMSRPPFQPVIYRKEQDHTNPRYFERWALDFEDKARGVIEEISRGGKIDDVERFAEVGRLVTQLVRESGYVRHAKRYLPYSWKDLDRESGLKSVFAAGQSGMLIRREVFEAIPDPWFEIGQTNTEEIGEDTYFCEKLRASKFAIDAVDDGLPVKHALYVDLDIVFGHITPVAAWPTRHEDGTWTIRLQWEDGHNIVINRPDHVPVTVASKQAVTSQMNKSQLIIARSRELVKAGKSEADAFQQAVDEIEREAAAQNA